MSNISFFKSLKPNPHSHLIKCNQDEFYHISMVGLLSKSKLLEGK